MNDQHALREMFRSLRGEEARLRRPPPAGVGAVFLAEGARLVARTQASGHRARALLVSTRYSGALPPLDCPVLLLDAAQIQALTGFGAVREMLGMFERPPDATAANVLVGARRVVVLEGVANPANVGTIIRSAAALGIDATLIGPGSGDPLGRRALRTSMGASLNHPWASVADPITTCREHGLISLALTPDPTARSLAVALAERSGTSVAILLGAEGPGLRMSTQASADERVTIPMAGGVDSLNVAAAAAIAFHLMVAPVP